MSIDVRPSAERDAPRPGVAPPPRFSLRARLLAAVAVVALVGLLVADLATYAALKTFLVDRIDSSLDSANRPLTNLLFEQTETRSAVRQRRRPTGPRSPRRRPARTSRCGTRTTWPVVSGSTRGDYATVDARSLPDARLRARAARTTSGTSPSTRKGDGPDFRVRAEELAGRRDAAGRAAARRGATGRCTSSS